MRLRRTLLLTPGHRRERLEKALGLGADAVVFDLEDGVPPARKAEARANAAAVLRTAAADGPERMVRINAVGSGEWEADLAALPLEHLNAIMLAKVESAAAMQTLDAALAAREATLGLPPVGVIATLETPRGLFHALAIADAVPRCTGLFFGPGDYTALTGGAISKAGLQHPRAVIAAAAGAAGCQAIDGPYLDIKDPEGTARDTADARELGFTGKVVFHPAQIGAVNAAFMPGPAEVARAERIVRAWREAEASGAGVVFADGEFIAVDLVPRMERVLALARAAP